jgi:hypothetical protein
MGIPKTNNAFLRQLDNNAAELCVVMIHKI